MIERKTYKNKIIHGVYEWVVLTYEITENGEKLLFANTGNSDTKILRKIHKKFFDNIRVGKTIENERINEC